MQKVKLINNIFETIITVLDTIKTIAIVVGLVYGISFANNVMNRLDNLEKNVNTIKQVYTEGNDYMKNKALQDLDSLQSKVKKFKTIFK